MAEDNVPGTRTTSHHLVDGNFEANVSRHRSTISSGSEKSSFSFVRITNSIVAFRDEQRRLWSAGSIIQDCLSQCSNITDIAIRHQGNGKSSWSRKTKIKIFFHIAAIHRYTEIIAERMTRLIFSGLYDRSEGIYCFIMSPTQETLEEAQEFLRGFGTKIVIANTTLDCSLYERFTLLGLQKYIQTGDYLLYLHTKGVTTLLSGRPMEDRIRNIYYWVLFMDYWLIFKYKTCLMELETHDVIGVNHFPAHYNPAHFSGNFFWATADYFLSLRNTSIGNGYNDPEFHVTSQHPKWKSLYQPGNDWRTSEETRLYDVPLPPKIYMQY